MLFNIIMKAIELFIKGFILILKVGADLFQKGILLPIIVLAIGGGLSSVVIYHGEQQEELTAQIGFKILGVLVLIGVFALCMKWIFHILEKRGLMPRKFPDSKKTDHLSPTPHGVVFGKQGKQYVCKPEDMDGHVLVVGGVGSGKSSAIAIPTLRAWKERVFAIDIKGELYEHSKNHRQKVRLFDPLDPNSYGYDPFYCLRNSKNPTQEARAIAQAIIPLPPDIREPFWIENAQNILTGAILGMYQKYSFIDTLTTVQETPPKDLIEIISKYENEKARLCVSSFIGMEDKTLSGIFAELSRNIITLVTDDDIISALSRTKNITPKDLEDDDIYIQIPEHLLKQWKSLLTLIVNQFLTHFEQRNEEGEKPILFLLDEFPRLGKVSNMLDGLATLRSKKICICPIIQSLAQLDLIYGYNERKVIADTCSFKAILGASDPETQRYFSDLVGTYDKPITAHGTNTSPFALIPSTSTNTKDEEKRIIKPEDFGRLEDIVLLTPKGYDRVEKAAYWGE